MNRFLSRRAIALGNLLGAVGFAWLLAACPQDTTRVSPVPSSSVPSPNAKILPAPLKPASEPPATVDSSEGADALYDAGRPPPSTMREDDPLLPDPQPLSDPRGLTLKAAFRWHGLPPAPTSPETNALALEKARKKTTRGLIVDLSPAGRLRMMIAGPAFPLPPRTELRARTDRYGHILVWPDGASYRVLQPGTLRALFQEGRADVGPLVPAEVATAASINVLGYQTQASTVTTSLGSAVVHQASIPGINAGELLCRTLLELLAAEPTAPLCNPDLVPLRVEYHWKAGGQLTFDVTSLVRTANLDMDRMRVPPRTPSFKGDRLPQLARAALLDDAELRALRKRPMPVEPADGGVVADELVAVNKAETIRYLLVDGIPVARVPPHSERRLESLLPGRYVISWVDFLGVDLEPGRQEQVPLRVEVGGSPDAGSPLP